MKRRRFPVALLAGGLATRLRPITETIPKAMVEVAGRPFIHHQLALLARCGFTDVLLCLGNLGEQVRAYVNDGADLGLTIRYSEDGTQLLGTGGALRQALPLLGDTFWVLYGDSYLEIDYAAIEQQFQTTTALGLMTIYRNANQWDRSNVVYRDEALLVYDKHNATAEMEYIDYGATLLRKAALRYLSMETPADLADLYHTLARDNLMIGYVVTQRFYEIGSPTGLAETRAYLEERSR